MVVSFLRKNKIQIIFGFLIVLLYFLTRLFNLLSLPIFTDEALYVRWAQIAGQDASWRFISLTDGKQPLFIWLTMIAIRFIDDPLLAGRLISVISGFITMVGLFFLGKKLFGNVWIGLISSFLYVIYPFSLVYDRMALYESLVSAFSVWGLYLTIILVKSIRLDVALILGMVSGFGVLTKSSNFFIMYLLPFSLVLFDFKSHNLIRRLLQWVVYAGVIVVLTYGYYSILRLSPFFNVIQEKNALFVYPFSEWIQHPFEHVYNNWRALFDWLIVYYSPPFLAITIGAFFISKSYFKEKVLLSLWFLLPFLLLLLFGRILYPRYILFMTMSLVPLAAYTFYHLYIKYKNIWIFAIIFLISITAFIRTSFLVLTDFSNAPIPFSDVSQYNNNWPSGTGVRESVKFFEEKAKNQKIFVATQGTFGLLPHALELYLNDNPNITVRGIWPISEGPPQEVIDASQKMPTFFVFYQPCTPCLYKGVAPDSWNYKIVLQIQKAAPDARFTVYQIQ